MRTILALVIAVIARNLLALAAVYYVGDEKNAYCPVRSLSASSQSCV